MNSEVVLDKKEIARVKNLFESWKAWLFFLSFSYIIGFSLWSIIDSIIKFLSYSSLSRSTPFFLFCSIVVIILRGLMFCADGLVTSYLKSPFNQICYSINKLDGLPRKESDAIVSLLTEINEHLKETFKKFGITTIVSLLPKILDKFFNLNINFTEWKGNVTKTQRHSVSSISYILGMSDLVMTISLLIPMVLAYHRLLTVEKKILEIEKLSEHKADQSIEDEETK